MKYKRINPKFIHLLVLLIVLIVLPALLINIYRTVSQSWMLYLGFSPAIAVNLFIVLTKTKPLISKFGFNVPKRIQGKIRISYSSLIRIKLKQHYLLVLGNGNNPKYQPPGGVFHYNGNYIENEMGFERDSTGSDSKDIRGTISIYQLPNFLKWIDEETHRETSPKREFEEELIKTSILNDKLFNSSDLKFSKRKFKNGAISYSVHHQIDELIIFDIYFLKLSDKQNEWIQSLMDNQDDERYIFANKKEILREGVNDKDFSATITDHAKYILEGE